MDMKIKDDFTVRWKKYFKKDELPVIFYYTDDVKGIDKAKPASEHRCFICDLAKVRKGKTIAFDIDSLACSGGKRYLGFTDEIMPNFEYFLSCGIPKKLEGERYKKTPELVRESMKKFQDFKAPAEYIVFKRWDDLEEHDEPQVAVFFAVPDVLSGLFTLAGFDESDSNMVFTPFAAGCGSIVQYPYLEKNAVSPRGVIGMFDVSARPYVPENVLTFAVPMKKFIRMIKNMDESFLITSSWDAVRKRMG